MRKAAVCVCLCMLFIVSSCTGQSPDGDPFSVFKGNFKAGITAVCNGNESQLTYIGGETSEITFSMPKEISGFTLEKEQGKIFLSYDGIKTEIPGEFGILLDICEKAFGASPDEISEVRAEKTETGTVSVVITENCKYVFCEDGTPASVEGNFGGKVFMLTFTSFEKLS